MAVAVEHIGPKRFVGRMDLLGEIMLRERTLAEIFNYPGTLQRSPLNSLLLYSKVSGAVSKPFFIDEVGDEFGLLTVDSAGGTAGHIAFWESADVLGGDANLFWDDTNKRLGLGTSTPATQLQITGVARIGGLTASRLVASDANKDLVSTITAANLLASVTGTTGTVNLVFSTSPTLTTPVIASFTTAQHTHQNAAGGGQLDHGLALTGLTDDDHTQYRLESADHSHQSTGLQAGTLDHGLALTGLTDDDHTQYALLAGRSGGQSLIGGTGSGDDLQLDSTSHATKGHVGLSDLFQVVGSQGVAVRRSGVAAFSPTSLFHVRTDNSGASAFHLESTDAGANGVGLLLSHLSASPADNDTMAEVNCRYLDDGATARIGFAILPQVTDVTSTTLDSQCLFATQNNVNAGDVNTFASLNSIGEWTNACMERGKEFEGDPFTTWPDFWERLKKLRVQRFRAANLPPEKVPLAPRHIACSAENLEEQFGLASKIQHPFIKEELLGIGSNVLGSLAIVAVQNLVERVEFLEKKVA